VHHTLTSSLSCHAVMVLLLILHIFLPYIMLPSLLYGVVPDDDSNVYYDPASPSDSDGESAYGFNPDDYFDEVLNVDNIEDDRFVGVDASDLQESNFLGSFYLPCPCERHEVTLADVHKLLCCLEWSTHEQARADVEDLYWALGYEVTTRTSGPHQLTLQCHCFGDPPQREPSLPDPITGKIRKITTCKNGCMFVIRFTWTGKKLRINHK
jgi:hypothetical protein